MNKGLVQFTLLATKTQTGGSIAIDPAKVVAAEVDDPRMSTRLYFDGGFIWLVKGSYEDVVTAIWGSTSRMSR